MPRAASASIGVFWSSQAGAYMIFWQRELSSTQDMQSMVIFLLLYTSNLQNNVRILYVSAFRQPHCAFRMNIGIYEGHLKSVNQWAISLQILHLRFYKDTYSESTTSGYTGKKKCYFNRAIRKVIHSVKPRSHWRNK